MAGLEEAAALGFHPMKINCVVLKDMNDDELLDFARLARERPFQVRFIEFMPTVSRREWARHFLPMAEVRRRLAALGPGEPVAQEATAGPARIFRFPGFRGSWGLSAPSASINARTVTVSASPPRAAASLPLRGRGDRPEGAPEPGGK